MFLSPIIGRQLHPKLLTYCQQRNIRPTIKIAKEKFQLQIDVENFTNNEIRVKARLEYVIIEGKQERKTKTGYVIRQFVRKFKLPEGTDPLCMKSTLSSNGILTITAPRRICEPNFPCEKFVPITCEVAKKQDQNLIGVQSTDKEEKKSVCDNILNPPPKPPDKK